MSSQSPIICLSHSLSISTSISTRKFANLWTLGSKAQRVKLNIHPICNSVSKPVTQDYFKEVIESRTKWEEDQNVDDDTETNVANYRVCVPNKIKDRVDAIRSMLSSMEDGEISISAYDTAWVALVQDVNGSGAPQFPTSLEWIVANQLDDGSWGDCAIFSSHDRILNTLACVIALKFWDCHQDKRERGILFIKKNIYKLEDENAEHMPIGFEVAFPSLLEMAHKLDIEVPNDSPFLLEIYTRRNLKLKMIPKDVMHKVATTLLHSIEGMRDLDWEKLLKLQCQDGSFLFSPSSTAFALMQTKDDNCLAYLNHIVQRFHGGVPNVYPVDLFEHMWAVDRLQRLGISRYFHTEIKECLDYIYRHWTEKGICWARNSRVEDIDDTAMGFRLLRLHGYDVSLNVFRQFEKGGEFVCFAGQSTQAVTGMYNLYRASQMMFSGENLLEDARRFSFTFLKEKQACNELLDKWIITKDLPGEVGYALDVPWHASLPRLETRFYIEHYGGEDDVWIGKTLYRMPFVNNNNYLELAKLDFNDCQAIHQLELDGILRWYVDINLEHHGISRVDIRLAYFLAAASIFESERSCERVAWAKTSILLDAIAFYFSNEATSNEEKMEFIDELKSNSCTTKDHFMSGRRVSLDENKIGQRLVWILVSTINQLSLDALVAHGKDIRHHLSHAWEKWVQTINKLEGADMYQGEADVLVQTINHCGGLSDSDELFSSHSHYQRLSELTSQVCHHLHNFQYHKIHVMESYNTNNENDNGNTTTPEIEMEMQELAQLVLQSSSIEDINADIKKTFLIVAKSYYYAAYCNPDTINSHMSKVLFERVI